MSTAASTDRTPALPARNATREAHRWIERQLRWEQTLGSLRHRTPALVRKAA